MEGVLCANIQKTMLPVLQKESKWRSLHEALLDENSKLLVLAEQLQVSTAAISFLAIAFQEKCISRFTQTDKSQEQTDITADQKDILQYIGGAMIHKLLKRFSSLADIAKYEEILDVLDSLHLTHKQEQLDHTYAKMSLVALKSRGKLKTPTEKFAEFIYELERFFKVTVKLSSKTSLSVFFQKYVDSSVRHYFYDAINPIEPNKNMEKLEQALVALYFKIRRHHSCKVFLEKQKCIKKSTGKSRALRTKLADKNTL